MRPGSRVLNDIADQGIEFCGFQRLRFDRRVHGQGSLSNRALAAGLGVYREKNILTGGDRIDHIQIIII
ncbi:hypothetical protein JW926_07260 [Candidatus Sumerlaeota bacterium]|nr:hypothetical protein [Candidatus Sumerlaeota bacterium]